MTPREFDEAIHHLYPTLIRIARTKLRRHRREQECEDVVQTTLLRLWERCALEPPGLSTFIQALNMDLIDHLRLAGIGAHHHGEKGASVLMDQAPSHQDPELSSDIESAMNQLPNDKVRVAVWLTWVEGWTELEVAQLSDVSVRTVYYWLEGAKATLKDALTRYRRLRAA